MCRTAARDIEPYSSSACLMQLCNALVISIAGNLGHPDVVGAERLQGVDELPRGRGMETARDRSAALDVEPLDALLVVRHGNRYRHVAVILLQRVRWINDVKVGIKYFVLH